MNAKTNKFQIQPLKAEFETGIMSHRLITPRSSNNLNLMDKKLKM